jgi:hypothetical protein
LKLHTDGDAAITLVELNDVDLEQISGGADALNTQQLLMKAMLEARENTASMGINALDSTARALSAIWG